MKSPGMLQFPCVRAQERTSQSLSSRLWRACVSLASSVKLALLPIQRRTRRNSYLLPSSYVAKQQTTIIIISLIMTIIIIEEVASSLSTQIREDIQMETKLMLWKKKKKDT